jgi:Ca-activated chloride channel family protein
VCGLAALLMLATGSVALANDAVMILMDASASMGDPLGKEGMSKMEAAKRVIQTVMQRVPPQTQVGLRVFGQTRPLLGSCQSTALLVPLGTGNRALITSQAKTMKPTGETPITHALQTATREDFIGVTGKKVIFLVSDGEETCDTDPCKAILGLMRQGYQVEVNTVGFGRVTDEAQRQLRCAAAATYGSFINARTSAELADRMQRILGGRSQVSGKILTPQTGGR